MIQGIVRGQKKPPRIVLYAPPKWGKSTSGAESENPVFVTTEDGVDNLPVDQFKPAKEWLELLENLKKLLGSDYKTIVLDTLNGASELAAQHVCKTQFGGNWTPKRGQEGFLSWAAGWKSTSEEMRSLLVILDSLRDEGKTILLLAHTGMQSVKTPESDYSKFTPDIDKYVWARFSKWADIILRGEFEHTIVKEKIISTSKRIVHCSGSQSQDAGTRVGYDLPESFTWSWNEFKNLLGTDTTSIPEVKRLWNLLNQTEQEKTLIWLGGSIETATSQKIKQLLNKLKEKEHA